MNRTGKLWAITSFFNPRNYRTRNDHYHSFRKHLHVPLITVELSFNSKFFLKRGDAEKLVQISCGDVLWQKERLLNLALEQLPQDCEAVAWLDCDILLESKTWNRDSYKLLDEYPLVQPFVNQVNLGPADRVLPRVRAQEGDRKSFAYCWKNSLVPDDYFTRRGLSELLGIDSGHAYVARREIVDRHGFYDAFVIGGADKMMAAAAVGRAGECAKSYGLSARFENHFLSWAREYQEAIGGQIGYVEGNLYHLWHGSIANRDYVNRQTKFKRFDFDPTVDIRQSESGSWEWNSNKAEMHDFVENYFKTRNEDSPD